MLGVVLAAGMGSRLLPLTASLPKTLLPVRGRDTIFDLAVSNLTAAGIEDITVVTGFAHESLDQHLPDCSARFGVRLTALYNDKALVWNNAYSLWLARDLLREGALVVNGDTVHPPEMERELLSSASAGVVLAVDRHKTLAYEEMKVHLTDGARVTAINKALDPGSADGEYVGITRVDPGVADDLADALESVWQRDTSLYYEDGYQVLADRGGPVVAHYLQPYEWVEVDDHVDLARAREVTCRY